MQTLTRFVVPGLIALLSVETASVSPAQLVPRSKPWESPIPPEGLIQWLEEAQ